jgi:riboflavin synthase
MFTGIITDLGTITAVAPGKAVKRLTIKTVYDMNTVDMGASIACNGCCLTVVEKGPCWFAVDASQETLDKTTLGAWQAGDRVNLEKALRLSDRLGGHMVSGHVDGVGEVTARIEREQYVQFKIAAPAELARYIATKGSIAVEGVSLTVNAVSGKEFDLMIIPHTLERTTLGELRQGSRVNLEIDLVARYLERLHGQDGADLYGASPTNPEQTGFDAS